MSFGTKEFSLTDDGDWERRHLLCPGKSPCSLFMWQRIHERWNGFRNEYWNGFRSWQFAAFKFLYSQQHYLTLHYFAIVSNDKKESVLNCAIKEQPSKNYICWFLDLRSGCLYNTCILFANFNIWLREDNGLWSGSAWICINLSWWIQNRIQEGKNDPQK